MERESLQKGQQNQIGKHVLTDQGFSERPLTSEYRLMILSYERAGH